MDPLSDVLASLKPRTSLVHALDAGDAWAIGFPVHAGIKFDAVLKGTCWLIPDNGAEPLHLAQGDCFLLTSGRPFVLASDPTLAAVDYLDALSFDSRNVGRCKSGGDCFLIGGHFSFDAHHVDALLRCLPPVIHVSSASNQASVLRWALDLFANEMSSKEAGGSLTTEHLAHIMLIQVLRLYLKSADVVATGWLFALGDPQLAAAIGAIHGDIGRRWTLSELAKIAGMSRSSFAARFKSRVGSSPMEYLTRWRMQIAGDQIRTRERRIATIAHDVGYESEAAFSTAFRKIHGHSPRDHRK